MSFENLNNADLLDVIQNQAGKLRQGIAYSCLIKAQEFLEPASGATADQLAWAALVMGASEPTSEQIKLAPMKQAERFVFRLALERISKIKDGSLTDINVQVTVDSLVDTVIAEQKALGLIP